MTITRGYVSHEVMNERVLGGSVSLLCIPMSKYGEYCQPTACTEEACAQEVRVIDA